MQLKIKIESPPKERERREKVNEASHTLQQPSTIQVECQTWNTIMFNIYEKLLAALEMQEINHKVQQIDEKNAWIRASIVTLNIDATISAMQENTALVSKVGQLRVRQQQLLSAITKLQDEALVVNEQIDMVEIGVEHWLKNHKESF